MRTKRRLSRAWAIVFGLALAVPCGAWAASGGGGNDGKVAVNHKGKIIRVGPVAAAYHILIHGDTLGEPQDPGGEGSGV